MREMNSASASRSALKSRVRSCHGDLRRLACTIIAAAGLAAGGAGAQAQSSAANELSPPVVPGVAPSALWSYGEEDGPANWSRLSSGFAVCGVGSEQSPIDIRTELAPESLLPPVEILWERFVPEVVDTGRTILVRTGGQGGVARLNGVEYRFLHLLFHHRSEHLIDGKRADMEVQFVHQSEAGDFLIVAGLIVPGESNPLLEILWPLVPKKLGSQSGTTPVDPRALLPLPATEYRYAGSLTTPPCLETVTWSVRAAPITASEAQIATFAAYYKNNARPVQPLGRRFVLRRP